PQHPNPALVQRKIQRVRTRLYHLTPSESILNAAHPSRRIAALGPTPAASARPAAAAAPRHVAVDASNDDSEEERADGPSSTPPSEAAPIGDKK
ncbi:MAG TPA: hypothetical protein VFH51_12960, partial [Myxococcota bacterium]|nr:hypothetical protein [Myxococcota bacterium]